ncbi:ATP-binding protein [Reichenbachiella agariperforans]|uniref:ATP-binding protein n=1 Tax=Reichenbachiella agariperforans TaxID=156994 RepID=UPI001C093BFA|nr:ATP-binding protein [Reichenbachiella agariperforans]MBU2913638.1 response regulator [Reichenbachiella agariperforans]
MKKTLFPYFLSASLLFLTLGAAVVGYFAYLNLNNIIITLEREVEPNVDLITLGQVSNELERMENAIEGYVFYEDSTYMLEFEESTAHAIALLGEIKIRNEHAAFDDYIDSLEKLILNKVTLLNQATELGMETVEETIQHIHKIGEKKKVEPAEPAQVNVVVQTKKMGFFQKLLGKRNQEDTVAVDTVRTVDNRAEEVWTEVNSQLDSISRSAQKRAYNQKIREYTLYQDHLDIDRQIVLLIAEMESWQVEQIKTRATYAKDRAEFTNRYVTIFTVMAAVVLLITLTVLIIYVLRTRSYQDALSAARESALQTAQDKEQFLANMSHEIRTPMNAIAGFSNLLLKSKLSHKQKDQVAIIDKSSKHLLHIVNDVLDFTKLQSGKIRLEEVAFKPIEVIQDAVQLLEQKAHEKGLVLELKIGEMPSGLTGDPFRLKQILLNLIYNSIKFTEQGSVLVEATTVEKESAVVLQLSVTDTGIGIPTDRQQQIFEEFEQVSQGDNQKGTGLGLSITKKLIDMQQGMISLESKEGKGTVFNIQIPYQPIDLPVEASGTTDTVAFRDWSGTHVLIADDELFNRRLLTTILDEHGITYQEAEDGQIAYNYLTKERYDMLLLDFRMPKMNGPELAVKLRASSIENATIPIIGLTATISDQDILKAKDAGIDHVLRKPFTPEDLLARMAGELDQTNIESKEDRTPDDHPMFSLEGLSRMGDEAFVMDMVETFIQSTETNLDLLDQALQRENWEEAADVLHKIIAPARHFRLTQLVTLMKETELTARQGVAISAEDYKEIRQSTFSVIASLRLYLHQTQQAQ